MSMQVLVEIGKTLEESTDPESYPTEALHQILRALFDAGEGEVAEALDELIHKVLVEYGDVRYQCYQLFPEILRQTPANRFEVVAGRVIRHLGAVEVEEDVRKNLVPLPKCASRKAPIRCRSGHKSEYTNCWLAILRLIPTDALALHKRVLSLLDDTVIPSMTRPQLLGDYLIDAYNAGGIISLLALSSLFTLIRKHNLDYPDFFPKLYSLLDGRILHIYYRRRFLRLLDMFMQSTMLPAYIVAAFAKRTARLALYAPAPSVQWVVPFVYNLLKRHPACRVMIHREDVSMQTDPFDSETTDLARCGAIDSSLWELQSLTKHYWGSAARQASIFADRFTKPPFDLEKVLNESSFTYEEIIEDELSHRWSKRPPTNLDIPTTAFD